MLSTMTVTTTSHIDAALNAVPDLLWQPSRVVDALEQDHTDLVELVALDATTIGVGLDGRIAA